MVTRVEQAIEQLSGDPSISCLNLTDPDSLIMKGKKGDFDTNYNVQVACSEDQIITFCDVVLQGNDKAQLIPALQAIAQNTGKIIEKALADADYGTFESLEYMDQNQIEGYVPYRDMNTTYEDQPFHKAHFVYDKALDRYSCPAQKSLEFYRSKEDKKRQQHFKYYRTDACKGCPFKSQCCKKGTARRVIERESRQDLRDQMKQRLNSLPGQKVYRKRLHPIESLFGHLKFNLHYSHFLLRGLKKVKAEFALMCITHNLRKLITNLACSLSTKRSTWADSPQNRKKMGLPRFVNELLLNTLVFWLTALDMPIYTNASKTLIPGQPA